MSREPQRRIDGAKLVAWLLIGLGLGLFWWWALALLGRALA